MSQTEEKSSTYNRTLAYESDGDKTLDDEDSSIESSPPPKIRWRMVVKTFEDEQEAHEWLQQDEQQCWSKHYLNPSFEGDKSYYQCNKVKSRGPQCAS
jgi:hypothetical protein